MADPKVFQLADDDPGVADASSSFARFGYLDNPFPITGLHAPLYKAHMSDELRLIDDWLKDVQEATRPENSTPTSIRPLAIRGALGVGKTHLLLTITAGLGAVKGFEVARKDLADEGMTKLLLASLLLGSLPNIRPGAPSLLPPVGQSALPLLDEMTDRAWALSIPERKSALRVLGKDSVLLPPLEHVLLEVDRTRRIDYRRWLALWLIRGHTTPQQRAKIGLAGVLESEGQAIRATADLVRFARRMGCVQIWFLLLDQLEETWRHGVITEARQARFLTDVRGLIDDALEGAPIAVLLAWNTEARKASDELELRYRALYQRLGAPVDLPGLRTNDIWPFAEHYLRAAELSSRVIRGREDERRRFVEHLKGRQPVVMKRLKDDSDAQLGDNRFALRRVLAHWRAVSDEHAAAPVRIG